MTQDVKVPRSEVKYTPYRKTPKSVKGLRSVRTPATLNAKKPLSFSLGPKLPNVKLSLENNEETQAILDNFIKILRARKQKGETNKKEFVLKEDHFRKRLTQIHQQNVLGISEIRNFKAQLKKQKQASHNLQTKITDLETVNDSLATKNEELQQVIRSLQSTIEEKNLKINQNHLEREKTKQKFALQSAKMTQELDEKLRKQREHLHAAMQNQDAKLKKVKEILDGGEAPLAHSTPESIHEQDYEPQQTPPQKAVHRRNVNKPNRHRRSRSAGEVWLEHNAVKPVPLGTVFQPFMKKRKSVTKLDKAKDVTNSKQNRYCLIAQEADGDGEVETKLYKGDILPTCGGGAQVVFNDVERLRQESPTHSPAVPNQK